MRALRLAAFILGINPAWAQPHAIDGDTFVADGTRYRLWGIDAPELNQTCSGQPVGQWSKDRLQYWLNKGVSCDRYGFDRYNRPLVVCGEINRMMVREGYAYAYRKYATAYVADETGAGPVHQHKCENPEEVRRKK